MLLVELKLRLRKMKLREVKNKSMLGDKLKVKVKEQLMKEHLRYYWRLGTECRDRGAKVWLGG
jgi:hypothetical protein